jgi:hypothetical protein
MEFTNKKVVSHQHRIPIDGVGTTKASTVVQRISVAAITAKTMELNHSLPMDLGCAGLFFFQNFKFIELSFFNRLTILSHDYMWKQLFNVIIAIYVIS